MKKNEKRYELKCEGVAELLGGVLVSTIRTWAAKGVIPHRRFGQKTIRFCREEVLQWAEQHKVEAKSVKS